MLKKWEININKNLDKKELLNRSIMAIFNIRDRFMPNKNINLSSDYSWEPRSSYSIPKGILPIEALFFFEKTDINAISIQDPSLSIDEDIRAWMNFSNGFGLFGNEDFYKNCCTVWEEFKDYKPYKKIDYIMDGVVTLREEKVSYSKSFKRFLEDINNYNIEKNFKILFKNENEFVKFDNLLNFDEFIADKKVKIIINYDKINRFYGHLDFIGNNWATYKWE